MRSDTRDRPMVEGRSEVRLLTQDVYEIAGRKVRLPVEVRDADAVMASFLVPVAAAAELIGRSDVRPATPLPGRAVVNVGVVDYHDNDIGRYREVTVLVFARPADEPGGVARDAADLLRSRLPAWICEMPVDDEFSRAVGQGVWGYPKCVMTIDIEPTATGVVASLRDGQRTVLTLYAAQGGGRPLRPVTIRTLTEHEGRLVVTEAEQRARQAGFRLGGAYLELGDHPMAHRLARAGVRGRAAATMWMRGMAARFGPPVPIDGR